MNLSLIKIQVFSHLGKSKYVKNRALSSVLRSSLLQSWHLPWPEGASLVTALAALLVRHSSWDSQFTLTRRAVQWVSVHLQGCDHPLSLNPERFITPRTNPIPISSHPSSSPPPGPWKPIPVLGVLYKWNPSLCGLLCLFWHLALCVKFSRFIVLYQPSVLYPFCGLSGLPL